MKKIPSLFLRDFGGNPELVTRTPNPDCQWVFDGLGEASRKRDGTACMFRKSEFFKRYDAKQGKTPPDGFEPCQDPDPKTGHWPGWVPIGPDDKWHLWYWYSNEANWYADGTYELCGPKVQGNPEKLFDLTLFPHGSEILTDVPRDYDGLKAYFESHEIEGVVFANGADMCKIKRSDFGFKWPVCEDK